MHQIDYKDVKLLQRFVSERGKIVPRRITAVTAKEQRELARRSSALASWRCYRSSSADAAGDLGTAR